ncbi:MAG: PduL/EutD family phosphate acyltransferase [Candidatus Kerfeldbacteria bacterium]
MISIPIELSARHIHITKDDWVKLFGTAEMTLDHPISLPKQFVAKERVVLKGPKGEYANVGVVGPFRQYTQVELSLTEARHLGIAPPLSDSGLLDNAATITIEGPVGEITKPAAIIQQRHLHLSPDDAKTLGLSDRQVISVRVGGPRGALLNNVYARVDRDFTTRLHLDTDEGNACGVVPGMTADVVK